MEYTNEQLMAEWNDFNIALKVWLHPDQFGDKLADLQHRYPKPDLSEIGKMFTEIMFVLRQDSKSMIKY